MNPDDIFPTSKSWEWNRGLASFLRTETLVDDDRVSFLVYFTHPRKDKAISPNLQYSIIDRDNPRMSSRYGLTKSKEGTYGRKTRT